MKENIDFSPLLDSVISLVKEAVRVARDTELSIVEKGAPENIVTSSDLAVQRFLYGRLSELLPDSTFLCEEENLSDKTGENISTNLYELRCPYL